MATSSPIRKKFQVDESSFTYHAGGLSAFTTALFLIGEMAGGGIVAMPGAVYNAGWIGGIIFIVIGALSSGYTGIQLGHCWTLLQEMYPEYRQQCRKPYPAMGQRAFGWPIKHLVSLCIWLTLFMASVAYMILCGQQIQNVVESFAEDRFSFCFLMVIIYFCLVGFTWLGTPSDFWFVSIGAMGTSCISSILIIIGAAIDRNHVHYDNTTGVVADYNLSTVVPTGIVHVVQHKWVDFAAFASAYGTIAFAYGGHSAFPTMQHDMQRPSHFWKSVIGAYSVIICLYLPVGVVGYYFYGDLLANPLFNGNVTDLISTKWIKVIVSILIGAHVMFSMLIVVNPVNQELEVLLGIGAHFNIFRLISRSFVFFLSLFLAESVPQFGSILSLVGATTITMLTFVFPGLFYLTLKKKTRTFIRMMKASYIPSVSGKNDYLYKDEKRYETANWEYAVNGVIIFIGMLASLAGLYGSIESFINNFKFDPPCYMRTLHDLMNTK